MNDFMLDIETLGTRPGCAVLSIGAVTFDRKTGEIDRSYHRIIDPASCEESGLRIEAGTASWWMMQSDEARKAIFDASEFEVFSLKETAREFIEWCAEEPASMACQWWAQGATFDFPILTEAMRAVEWPVPWLYWNCRDTRTAYDLCGFDRKTVDREGTHHSALDDCRHQVRCLHAALKAGGLV